MEEKPRPRSGPLLVVGILCGFLSGFIGGIWGLAVTSGRGGPPERLFIATVIAAPILGLAFALAMWFLLRLRSRGMEWLVQLLVDLLGAGLLCAGVFYVFARMMKS